MTMATPLDTAFIRQLWRDVLMEGIRASTAAHRPIDPNGAMYIADEVVKRYVDRFEPEYDDADLCAVMDADHERVKAEREEYIAEAEAKAAEAKEADRRIGGPFHVGESFTRKSTGEVCTVLVENGKPQVHVKLASGRKLNVSRDDLVWREPEVTDAEREAADEQRVAVERTERHLEAVQ